MPNPSIPQSLRAALAKRRWSTAEARMVHDTFVRSGDTADAFAARHGLQPLRVRRLHAALAARADDTAVHFAELTVATTGASDPGALRLDIGPSTIELRVLDPDRCPPEWLATLARALRGHAS